MLTCLKSDNPDPSSVNRILSEDFWKYSGYVYNNETNQQLKNSGNLRLVKDKAVDDSILFYDNVMNSFVINQYSDLKATLLAYKEAEAKVFPYSELQLDMRGDVPGSFFDSADFKININKHTFITSDKGLMAYYNNRLFIHGMLCYTFIANLNAARNRATRLMRFIDKQYPE